MVADEQHESKMWHRPRRREDGSQSVAIRVDIADDARLRALEEAVARVVQRAQLDPGRVLVTSPRVEWRGEDEAADIVFHFRGSRHWKLPVAHLMNTIEEEGFFITGLVDMVGDTVRLSAAAAEELREKRATLEARWRARLARPFSEWMDELVEPVPPNDREWQDISVIEVAVRQAVRPPVPAAQFEDRWKEILHAEYLGSIGVFPYGVDNGQLIVVIEWFPPTGHDYRTPRWRSMGVVLFKLSGRPRQRQWDWPTPFTEPS